MKILMIGADALNHDCVRRITQEWGHQLEKAKTGEEALTMGAEKDYDLAQKTTKRSKQRVPTRSMGTI